MSNLSRIEKNIQDLKAKEQYSDAISLALRLLKFREQFFNSDHPKVASTLNVLSDLYRASNKLTAAKKLLERALNILEHHFGKDDVAVGATLIRLGEVHRDKNEYNVALPLFERALAIAKQSLGLNHAYTGIAYQHIALLHELNKNYSKAVIWWNKALNIEKQQVKPDHFQCWYVMDHLATAHQRLGHLDKARRLLLRSIKVVKDQSDLHQAHAANSLNNLALAYQDLGKYEQAVRLLDCSLSVIENVFGKDHQEVATHTYNLGNVLLKLADYKRARPILERSLTIRENRFGKDSVAAGNAIHTLGLMYLHMGDFKKAKSYLDRSYAITEQTKGVCHEDTVASLHGLGLLHHEIDDHRLAQEFYERALRVGKQVWGESHPNLAPTLTNLGQVYSGHGDHHQAERLYRQALNHIEAFFGSEHPDRGIPLRYLSVIYHLQGEYQHAHHLLEEALKLQNHTLQHGHPSQAGILAELAISSMALGNFPKALEYLQRSISAENVLIRNVLNATISEEQKLSFFRTVSKNVDIALCLIVEKFSHDTSVVQSAWEWVLLRKGMVFDAVVQRRQALYRQLSPKAQKLVKNLSRLLGNLCHLYLHQGRRFEQDGQATSLRLNVLESEIERVEAGLFEESEMAAFELGYHGLTFDHVMQRLMPDTVLVDFIKIKGFDFESQVFGSDRYVAIVIAQHYSVQIVEIGLARDIEPLVRTALNGIQEEIQILHLGKANHHVRNVLKDLYVRLWESLENCVGKAKKIFISPDGLLNLIPFAALISPNDEFLMQRHAIAYLTSSKDLIRPNPVVSPPEHELFLVANPDFGKGDKYPPLAGTMVEAERIPAILPGGSTKKIVLYAKDATKAALKRARPSKIVHLATHGFFLPKSFSSLAQRSAHGLLRSGLAFAGANRWYGKEGTRGDNGHLTALEVTGMDLYSTRLVVLSACLTGAGHIHDGEGVFGLRRAFALAGARSLMMSLWNITDEDTPHQLIMFYRHLLNCPPAIALQKAQVQAIQLLEEEMGESPISLWAPFIVQGPSAFERV